jgi:hypothetical protein
MKKFLLLLLLLFPSVCFSNAALMGEESLTMSGLFDFECYFDSTWSDPTYTMGGNDIDDGDTTGAEGGEISITTTQAYSGSSSLYVNALYDNLNFNFTRRPSEFTIDLYVYIPDLSCGENQLFSIYIDGGTQYRARVRTDGTVRVDYACNGWVTLTTTATVTEGSWTHIEITSSVAEDKLSARVGNGSWEDDTDTTTMSSFGADPSSIVIGSQYLGACGMYIDNFRYKAEYTVH